MTQLEELVSSFSSEQKLLLRDILGHDEVEVSIGWRLPTLNELRAMYDLGNSHSIEGFKKQTYWSSTTHSTHTLQAWCVDFSNGSDGDCYAHQSHEGYVRCIRTGEHGLELSPSSVGVMDWRKAKEYADNLKVAKEDIVNIRLNIDTLLYEVVEC